MNSKNWLVMFILVSLLLIGGAGYFCYHFASLHKSTKDTFKGNESQIAMLQNKPLYPNKENVATMKGIVEDYKGSVDKLFASLDEFQRPLETDLVDSKFSIEMTQLASDFRRYCSAKGFEIQEAESFGLGFEKYSSTTPPKEIVAELEYGLNATEHLLRILVEAGGSKLEYISRDSIAGEEGGPKVDPTSTVVKYPIRLAFDAKHEALRTFINALPNDKKFFYVVRILQMKNRSQEGPYKSSGGRNKEQLVFENKETGAPASPEQLLKWGIGTLSPAEIIKNAQDAEFIQSGDDARQILGDELINAFMVVDVVRFIDPTKVKTVEEKKAAPTKKKSKR